MKYLKHFESLEDKIDEEDIYDIFEVIGLGDEFPDINITIMSSRLSGLLHSIEFYNKATWTWSGGKVDNVIDNSFIINLWSDSDKYIEYANSHGLDRIIDEFSHRLEFYGLKVYYHDFGDINMGTYDIIITDKDYNY